MRRRRADERRLERSAVLSVSMRRRRRRADERRLERSAVLSVSMRRRRRRADERRLERSAVGSAAVLLWFLGVFERLHGRMHATQAGGDLRSHRTPPLRLAPRLRAEDLRQSAPIQLLGDGPSAVLSTATTCRLE
jgi:hypothetical protein